MEKIIQQLKIQTVGDGWIDMICPPYNIDQFIDFCNSESIYIKGFSWWCYANEKHIPCGMGGPKSIYFDGFFSEIPMDELVTFENNEEYRSYLLEEWIKDSAYKECYWPGFWIER